MPSNTVKAVVAQLITSGKATHPYLGVKLSDSSDPAGAKVGEVASGSPADSAGLQAGDVVTAADGSAVTSVRPAGRGARWPATPPATRCSCRWARRLDRTVSVTLGSRS